MGISRTANLVYGFKIEDVDFAETFYNDKIDLPDELDVAFGGSAYWGDDEPMDVFICLKKARYYQDLGDDATKVHPEVSASEKKPLSDFIEEHDIDNADIGWWLFSEEG